VVLVCICLDMVLFEIEKRTKCDVAAEGGGAMGPF
jgi:hypothetical protein